jgi:hypothetical protein
MVVSGSLGGTALGLAAALEAMTDQQLEALLTERPDLVAAGPRSFAALASHAAAWWSQNLCLRGLDRWTLQVLETLALDESGASTEALVARLQPPGSTVTLDDVARALERLRLLGLVLPEQGRWVIAGQCRHELRDACGLGPPAEKLFIYQPERWLDGIARTLGLHLKGSKTARVNQLAQALADPDGIARLMATAPEGAVRLLEQLEHQPSLSGSYFGLGPLANRGDDLGWLLDRGLVAVIDGYRLVVPREVGLARRGGYPIRAVRPRPPVVEIVPTDAELVDKVATAEAERAVRLVDGLIRVLQAKPAVELKSGGLGVRELRRLAKSVEAPEPDVCRLLEIAFAANLVASGHDVVAPTPEAEKWLAAEPAPRWIALAGAWHRSERFISYAGQRDERDRVMPPLGWYRPYLDARLQREGVLAALAAIEPGSAADVGTLVDAVTWRAPFAWQHRYVDDAVGVGWVIGEAQLLGLVAEGALSSAGRALATGDRAAAEAIADGLLAEPTTSFTIQGDLTCLAPSTLHPALVAELRLLADVESTGAATVLRFTPTSVRRGFDAGRTAEAILTFLADHATKGVPQPLTYLVSDAARRHGSVRVGPAVSFVTGDDPALVTEVLHMKKGDRLGLRQIAPTVLVSTASPEVLVDALRGAGFLPTRHDAEGVRVVDGSDRMEVPVDDRPLWSERPVLAPGAAAGTVRRLRAKSQGRSPAELQDPLPLETTIGHWGVDDDRWDPGDEWFEGGLG